MRNFCCYARFALVFGLSACLQSTTGWSATLLPSTNPHQFFEAINATNDRNSDQRSKRSLPSIRKNYFRVNGQQQVGNATAGGRQITSKDNLDRTTTGSIDRNQSKHQSATSNYVPSAEDMAPAIEMPTGTGAKDQIAAYQILLDRAGASPGAIDGRLGSNVDKAAAAYGEITGKFLNPADLAAIEAELNITGGPAFKEYVITNEDVGRQFVASIPSDYAEKAQLESMAYTSVIEMLGERLQIDEAFLKEINPGVNFNQPGSVIKVPNLRKPKRAKVNYIIADKPRKQVRGYDAKGLLVVAYPATIGSSDTPSPSGTVQVKRIAINPNYTYNPRINFKQGNNEQILTIPPGPNGPVGTVWIALSKPTYGIHGTPDPSRIGKTSSHGCVRLTNWDAEELAKLVKSGVVVQFTE
ncbi:L,D-transpeptidase catalytic domain protein (plasmid) [Ochrobactrum quorumnocens]|uniref:L,D-transpeptidase catalytic domain protein n=1 Tax=Ochrobactrum quorumnocens TaxID=271865 RepID=A0A248UNE9_9HYPH|nr:L,D-transpeptidase catalytic domain protein [[Ochrobactrum] quorumnocens]